MGLLDCPSPVMGAYEAPLGTVAALPRGHDIMCLLTKRNSPKLGREERRAPPTAENMTFYGQQTPGRQEETCDDG